MSSSQKDASKSNNDVTAQPTTFSPTVLTSSSTSTTTNGHPSHKHLSHDLLRKYNPSVNALDEDDLSDVSSSSSASLQKKSFTQRKTISSTSESSDDDEYEVPSKEPYESKYITLTTINALDFLPSGDCTDSLSSDAVLTTLYKATKMTFTLCLASSIISAGIFFSSGNGLILVFINIAMTTWFIMCSLIWSFFLLLLNRAWPLGLTISYAKKASLYMTIIQFLCDQRFTYSHSDISFLGSVLSYGSVMSLPIFIMLEQFLNAYQKEKFRKQALLKVERENSQNSVYRALDRFNERKGLYLRTISDQLHQTTDLAMSTLKQLSPPHFLSKPHEQLSACSMSMPTTSINAVYTILKDVNYISTHLGTLSLLLFSDPNKAERSNVKREFDIGEMIQNVGDALAGVASCAKVELVIYHVDYGLNHLNVIGDEAALRHALVDLLKCMLSGASPGACVELGLQVRASGGDGESTSEKDSNIKPNDKVTCTIEIIHNPGSIKLSQRKPMMIPNANLVHKVLGFLGATLKADEESDLQRFEITIELKVGSPLAHPSVPTVNEEILQRYPHLRITGEPSVKDLVKTSQNMRGQKVALHATSKSFFAKHITSCLTTWGTDISHIPIGDEEDLEASSPVESRTGSPLGVLDSEQNSSVKPSSRGTSQLPANSVPPTFIIIDDDIETLKQQLTQLRNAPFPDIVAAAPMFNAKSGHNKRRPQAPVLPHQTTAVIHFTSLSNYKQVKDSVQCMLSPASAGSFPLPQVLVIPKPAGPRRFLNALHTTTNKIVVDPVYIPIATSPMSPGSQYANGLYASGEVNPMEQISDQSNNYFPSDVAQRSNTSSPSDGNVPRSTASGGPSSPRIIIFPKQPRNSDGRAGIIEKFGKGSSTSTTPPIYTNQTTTRILPNNQSPGTMSPTTGIPNANFFPEMPVSESPVLPSVPATNGSQPATPSQEVSTSVQNKPSPVPSTRRRTKPNGNRLIGVIPPINVLIVEDNPINQTILSTFMRKKKIKFECAANGQEAVDKWQKGGFHLVLMDIQMPVMDGIEATKTIRRLEKSQKIGVFPPTPPAQLSTSSPSSSNSSTPASTPSSQDLPNRSPVIIVALTASSLSSDRQNALAAGCNDFLTKPVSLEWLEKKINEWGCMQALIDFDGWRKWKKVEETEKSNEKKTGISKSLGSPGDKIKRRDTTLSRETTPPINQSMSYPPPSSNSVSPRSHTVLQSSSGEPISSHPNDASLSSSPFKPLDVGIVSKPRNAESDSLVKDRRMSSGDIISTSTSRANSMVNSNIMNSNITIPLFTPTTAISLPQGNESSPKRVVRKRGNTFSSSLNNS
ncbi:15992_t:CDS:2 [Acaulospora morrowiae]|uniref:15992_t:CDS:1 n=1 Tax=Acaulospora morrowiae TaxID=94023 RepID=A0A9N8VLF3_9GLOM|nr:15992_t:CDS:2 [Acaulospora morrowiae]